MIGRVRSTAKHHGCLLSHQYFACPRETLHQADQHRREDRPACLLREADLRRRAAAQG